MTRLAQHRDTHLTEEEIAVEALRRFDQSSSAPSIRDLAAALRVTPSAIYHHYPSRATIIQAAVELVWREAMERFLELLPDPFGADPTDVLVTAGIAARRAFGAHYQVAPFIAASPEVEGTLHEIMTLMADVFARMGLDDQAAAACFHTYGSFTIGAIVFAAERRITNEQLGGDRRCAPGRPGRSTAGAAPARPVTCRDALVQMMDISTTDPERDEELFADGLRRLVASFAPVPSGRTATERKVGASPARAQPAP